MALIQWTDSLSVQVAEIDGQHQKLVRMINELNDAMRQGKGKEMLGPIVSGLIGYARTHFSTEEQYFERFGYPDADSHRKEHAEFTRKVTEFKAGFDAGKFGLSIEIINFLSDWLQKHIMGVDRKYVSFFHEKGLK